MGCLNDSARGKLSPAPHLMQRPNPTQGESAMAATPDAAIPAAPPADRPSPARPASARPTARPEPWWVDALESVSQPYFAFCKGAAKVMRRRR